MLQKRWKSITTATFVLPVVPMTIASPHMAALLVAALAISSVFGNALTRTGRWLGTTTFLPVTTIEVAAGEFAVTVVAALLDSYVYIMANVTLA